MNEAIILPIAFLSRAHKPVQTCYDSGEPAEFKLWHTRDLSCMDKRPVAWSLVNDLGRKHPVQVRNS